MTDRPQFDPEGLRQHLAGQKGKSYWRGLEELAGTPQFSAFLEYEFPQHSEQAAELGLTDAPGGVNRRQVLSVMGASMAMAGLTACKPPVDKIVPYVTPPEIGIPGKPLFFASSFQQQGIAQGILVESHLGRPTKIEGNPDHPGSLGATDVFAQASILQLYDPDRSQTVLHLGNISGWDAFQAWFNQEKNKLDVTKGQGLHILTETIASPTLVDQFSKIFTQWPQAKWHVYEPAGRDAARAGSNIAFGEVVDTVYDFSQAVCILSLGSDFLTMGPGCVRYAREFAARRREAIAAIDEGKEGKPSRLYVAETTPTSTGAVADHRLPVRATEMESFAGAVAAGVAGQPVPSGKHQRWIQAVVKDLQKNAGASVVLAGDEQPAMVHALAHQINQALGNVGKTVKHTAPVAALPMNWMQAADETQSLISLNNALKAGEVDLLFIFGSNPRYNAPGDLEFRDNFPKARHVVHVGMYHDETAEWAHWHLPESHYLESWGDARAYDGTVSMVQPLIAPLYDSKSLLEIMTGMTGKPGRSGYDLVRDYWQTQKWPEFEATWRKVLHDGVVPNSALPAKTVALKAIPAAKMNRESSDLEVVFRPDPTIGDGRWANSGWLQELPKPGTRLTWDAVAQLSPNTAAKMKLNNEDMIELSIANRTVKMPVWISPGQAPDSMTVSLGYGRWRGGRVANGLGWNACDLRSSQSPWFLTGVTVKALDEKHVLAATHLHHAIEDHSPTIHGMEGRKPVLVGTFEEFAKNKEFFKEEAETAPRVLSLYQDFPSLTTAQGYGWGLTVDLSACVGCNACVVACQSENNIPVVGKEQVKIGREMHWIRIDRYYEGETEDPEMHMQPVMCQQCENAPCEVVCPVGATTHSKEGLNDMVYNRCVGTRYCGNNCPYKVRRFNFLAYQDWDTPSLKLMRNPNVTTRSRGVMEKCTFCVQRISAAKIDAEKEDRLVRDGEIRTACQQVCPAEAITFGNVHDPASKVSKLKASPLNYGLLAELQTRPRLSYHARLRNLNPELEGA